MRENMAIVHLQKRITDNIDKYIKYLRSSDSLIFVKGNWKTDESGPDCLSLTVGKCWYDNGRYIEIDSKKGIKIKPHASVVLETTEEIALPYNMYGLLFGAGSNIYKGSFISNGKIDPGFSGKLRIGYHNGSNKTIILKTGDKLAYCIFIGTECGIEHIPLPNVLSQPAIGTLSKRERLQRWFVENAYQILTISLSTISIIVSIVLAVFAK